MTIDKLSEFASDGQKDVDDLVLTDGFPVTRKPARQWFNWLFNTLTSKINEIIDADFMPKSDVVDNLTTDDATKPVSAKQARLLQDNKLDKTANAASATKLDTSRQVSFSGAATGSFNSDGSADTSCVLTLANSGATTGTYGSTLKIPVITVNTKGLITTVTTQDIPSASTSAKGLVQLNDTLTSTSITQALTAAQGKALQDDKLGKNENAASATNCGRSVVAGNGLSGGGELDANRTLTLGTPGTITASTGNTVDASSHTHNIDVNSLPLLGVGQSWQDVTSSRALGVTYTNNTGRPIMVSVSLPDTGSQNPTVTINVGGVDILVNNYDLGTGTASFSHSFIVPSGASYRISVNISVQVGTWAELR